MNRLLPAALLAIFLSTYAAGCRQNNEMAERDPGNRSRLASTLKDINVAPAHASIAGPMRHFFLAGLGFLVLGGVSACFGGKGTGVSLMFFGAVTTATGVLFVQYPWTVLLLALAAGVLIVISAVDRFRDRRKLSATARELLVNRQALTATTEAIQNTPEGSAVKARLSAMGKEIEETVRSAVTPIKEQLRRDGKI